MIEQWSGKGNIDGPEPTSTRDMRSLHRLATSVPLLLASYGKRSLALQGSAPGVVGPATSSRSGVQQWRQGSTSSSRRLADTFQSYASSADLVAANIAGDGVTILSASFQGRSVQLGLFSGGNDIIGLPSGAIFSTGSIEDIKGRNDGTFEKSNYGGAGFEPLTALTGNSTHDAAVLTIMFKCTPGRLSVKYVFGSEDYNPSNVGYAWEDVVGLFLNGLSPNDNIATVNGSYVSVKTINCGTSNKLCTYWINNTNLVTEMSGFTNALEAKGAAVTGINVLTVALADGFDGNYPSWLFLGQGSLKCGSDTAPAPAPPDSGEKVDKEVKVTRSGVCLKSLKKKCPCGNALQLQRCVKTQVESACVLPAANGARNTYIRGVTKRFKKLHCLKR
jgi:hypothetical protein